MYIHIRIRIHIHIHIHIHIDANVDIHVTFIVLYLDLQALLFFVLGVDRCQQVPQLLIVDLNHVNLHQKPTFSSSSSSSQKSCM